MFAKSKWMKDNAKLLISNYCRFGKLKLKLILILVTPQTFLVIKQKLNLSAYENNHN